MSLLILALVVAFLIAAWYYRRHGEGWPIHQPDVRREHPVDANAYHARHAEVLPRKPLKNPAEDPPGQFTHRRVLGAAAVDPKQVPVGGDQEAGEELAPLGHRPTLRFESSLRLTWHEMRDLEVAAELAPPEVPGSAAGKNEG